jgi:hypothetical protein
MGVSTLVLATQVMSRPPIHLPLANDQMITMPVLVVYDNSKTQCVGVRQYVSGVQLAGSIACCLSVSETKRTTSCWENEEEKSLWFRTQSGIRNLPRLRILPLVKEYLKLSRR